MLPALLTVLLFAFSGVSGERTARYWGSQLANLLRLLIATVVLVGVTLAFFRESVGWDTFWCLFWSGVVGFGFGDISLFQAYVRIGARLTILLNLCTAPIWSAVTEWAWLGTRLSAGQVGGGGGDPKRGGDGDPEPPEQGFAESWGGMGRCDFRTGRRDGTRDRSSDQPEGL